MGVRVEIHNKVFASVMGMATLTSLMKVSSPTMVWIMVNQVQLLVLLVLTKTDLPSKVVNFLTSNGFAMFCFEWIGFNGVSFMEDLESWSYRPQTDKDLEVIGIKSKSTYNNIFSLLSLII